MEYQKRLKFIGYIKKKFIDTDPNCKRPKGFNFKNYDDLDSIEMFFFKNVDLVSEHYEKNRYNDLGACVFTFDCAGVPFLAFEDVYLCCHIDISSGECAISDLNEPLRSTGRSLKAELNLLVRQLTGEDPPQRIFNC